MSLAALSLGALALAVLVSCVSTINIGVLAIALAWIVGVYIGDLTLAQLTAGFPSSLFLTLAGVTLLFAQADSNGTLKRIAFQAVRLCRGHRGVIPLMFFLVTLALSSVGPGNIAATALMVPLAMGVAHTSRISPFLISVMVVNGASAGSLSPFAPAGIVVNGIMADWGVPYVEAYNYLNNVIAHTVVALAAYLLFGGVRLFREGGTGGPAGDQDGDRASTPGRSTGGPPDSLPGSGPGRAAADGAGEAQAEGTAPPRPVAPGDFELPHWLTMAVIAGLIVGVVFFDVNVGMGAFAGAALLTILKAADERQAIARMPWGVILMISGVSLLVSMLEKTGGTDMGVALLAQAAIPTTLTAVAGFVSGIISIFSSTSGVVLPALIPMVPGLVERVGGGDLLAVASAMNITGHLVDLSPLSTLGALCLASAPPGTDIRRLFNKLLAWGFSMSVVGALVCWLLFGVLGVP